MTPAGARVFWRALIQNASALIADAHLLLSAGSNRRARSLAVLSQEELGKALWLYDTFSRAWSDGDETPLVAERLREFGRDHVEKYCEALVSSEGLEEFWGGAPSRVFQSLDEDAWQREFERQSEQAKIAAHEANRSKQRGFYVDRNRNGSLSLPTDRDDVDTTADDLRVAAQVIEMLLIRDHSRMKFDAVTEYDSTHAEQFRLLPVAHPEDWAAYEARAADNGSANSV
ncbi:MAG: hypothetical protein JWL72_3076 [Ilumatobacteraceae bacterium]|nr:hypothetical protein [Ilumatobacteraceae bacterium]